MPRKKSVAKLIQKFDQTVPETKQKRVRKYRRRKTVNQLINGFEEKIEKNKMPVISESVSESDYESSDDNVSQQQQDSTLLAAELEPIVEPVSDLDPEPVSDLDPEPEPRVNVKALANIFDTVALNEQTSNKTMIESKSTHDTEYYDSEYESDYVPFIYPKSIGNDLYSYYTSEESEDSLEKLINSKL